MAFYKFSVTVTFHNRYGIELAADLYERKNAKKGSLAAIRCRPMLRSSSRFTTPTTRRSAAIIRVP